MPVSNSGSAVDRMNPDDRAVLDEIKRLYDAGELQHLTWKQMFDVAKEKANFPGGRCAFQNYMTK